jgi:release factor glutamine methyltransferase
LIVSNPPYIDILEKSGMSDSVLEFEPHHALFAKDNGMYFYKEIESKSSKYISHNGKLVFEINPMKESYFIKNKYINLLDINGKTRFSILNILHDIK